MSKLLPYPSPSLTNPSSTHHQSASNAPHCALLLIATKCAQPCTTCVHHPMRTCSFNAVYGCTAPYPLPASPFATPLLHPTQATQDHLHCPAP